MRMIRVHQEQIPQALRLREAVLREVCGLGEEYAFAADFALATAAYLRREDQTTLLMLDASGQAVACATLCYLTLLPTFDHPTGKRAHLMNVYTAPEHRRQGLSRRLVEALMQEALQRGVTEISLDATPAGRPLYRSLGFAENEEGMVWHPMRRNEA